MDISNRTIPVIFTKRQVHGLMIGVGALRLTLAAKFGEDQSCPSFMVSLVDKVRGGWGEFTELDAATESESRRFDLNMIELGCAGYALAHAAVVHEEGIITDSPHTAAELYDLSNALRTLANTEFPEEIKAASSYFGAR